jgi:hypothetical protein
MGSIGCWAVGLALTIFAVAGAVTIAAPAWGGSATPSTLDKRGTMVAAYGGWAAWSRADASTNSYALVVRSPSGAIAPAPVAEREAPFDVELGPGEGGVVAVYSRCGDTKRLGGCRIYELRLGVVGAKESLLAAPGSSVHEPAIWEDRLVYLRRNPGGGERRPDNLFEWNIGAGVARAVKLPASRGRTSGEVGRWPKDVTGTISGLTLDGRDIAYATDSSVEGFGVASLWFQEIGGSPRLIDEATSGESATCEHGFLSPTVAGGWLYAYLHDCDPSANPGLDRWTRYRLAGREAQRAHFGFVAVGDESIDSVVADGGGVDWSNESGLHRLTSVSWRKLARPVPETFCSPSDPLC